MNRRVLVDSISEEVALAKLGVITNLVFDRLLLLTDDAGIAPGESAIIKGKCFAMMDDIDQKKIDRSVSDLVTNGFCTAVEWRGRKVVIYNPDSFQKHQRLRRDYVRRFNYGELSQLVWDKGLAGIRTESERNPNGSCTESVLISSVFSSVSDSDTGANAQSSSVDDAFEQFWQSYPRKVGKGAASKIWRKMKSEDRELATVKVKRFGEVWSAAPPDRKEFIPHASTWLNQRRWHDDEAEWRRSASSPIKGNAYRSGDIYDDEEIIRKQSEAAKARAGAK